MTIAHCIAMGAPFPLVCAGGATGQTKGVMQSEATPARLVMLVYQSFRFDKATASGTALAAAAHADANLEVPNSWIAMESVTGDSEVLSFDPPPAEGVGCSVSGESANTCLPGIDAPFGNPYGNPYGTRFSGLRR
jgi:hypothetical protein